MQAIHDSDIVKHSDYDAALLFNRKLWSIFVSSVTRNDHPLPAAVRQNVANIGVFVLSHTLAVTKAGDHSREHLTSLIAINRNLAAGLMGRA